MSNEVEPHTEQAGDEEDDLFGQDEDGQDPKSTIEVHRREEEDEEDLFGQDEDGGKKKDIAEEGQPKSCDESKIAPATNEEPADSTHSGTGNAALDTTKLVSPVSSPVPRKSVVSSPKAVVSVPRKNPGASHQTQKPKVESQAAKFNLPDAVIFPDTLDTALLEGRILETLRQLPANLCNDALQEYDDAIKQQKHIRSHGAYLFGVLKRYLSVHERAGDEGSMGHELTPQVQGRLEQLVRDGFCTQDEMNDKVKGKIRMLSEKDALFAIEEFASVDRGSIRNVGSYFMGILNRYMRGERNKDRQVTERDDRRRDRGRSDDHDSRGRRDNNELRYGMDRQYDAYRRDRSRDARDPYRNVNDRSDFDRQQLHYGHQQQPFPPPPPPRSPYGQQQQLPPSHHNFVPNHGYQQPPGSSLIQNHVQAQPNLHQHHQPPIVGHQPNAFQGHTQMPGMMSNAPVGIPNTGFAAPPVYQGAPQGTANTNPQSWQPPPQGAPQPDILGIAAKAAQALAASQNILQQPSSGFQQNPPPPVQRYGGQPPQMQFHGQPQQSQPFNPGFQPQQPQQNHPPQRRGRTTAMMHELTIAVQFAVQNLQTLGHISGPLDEGILGMIKDLPEPMALEAINRFAAMDKSSMRNTTAYLAGVLRRELEMINRR